MIRITVELVPFGIESRKRVIGSAKIWNDCTGTPTQGNYKFFVYGKRGVLLGIGDLQGFPRKRKNVWCLLTRCLNKFYGTKS